MKYRPEVDGLRAIAVLPVVLFHAGFSFLSGGFVGVDVFFVISGYLITGIIANEIASGSFSITNFYERRIRRIFPALFLVVAVATPLAIWRLLPADLEEFGQSIVALCAFATNMYFWSRSGYFSSEAELKPLLHTWSLSVEEQFYVLFPLLMLVLRSASVRARMMVLSGIALASLVLAQWGAMNKPIAAFFFLPTRAWELLAGSLVALGESRVRERCTHPMVHALLGWSGAAMLVGSMVLFNSKTAFPGITAGLPVLGSALIILFAFQGNALARLLSNRWLVGVGLISYSLYLWHHPVFAFARHAELAPRGDALAWALVALSMALAWLSWRFVERPFRDRQVFTRRQIFTMAGSVMALATACGLALSMSHGWVQRFSAADRDLVGVSFIERGDFVRKRFEAQHHRPFDPSDARTRVLLIGDSYAKDFINGVEASDWAQRVQISTHSISVGCGNLYVQDDLSKLVSNSYPPLCETEGRYRSNELMQLMQQAEVIWLVTSWQPWEVRFLKKSLDALRRDFGDKFVVVGAKSFGDIQPRELIKVPEAARPQYVNTVSTSFLANNQAVENAAHGVPFLNQHRLMCGAGSTCATFNADARLISYDGGHLTQVGAAKLGRELSAPDVAQRLLRQERHLAP